MTNARKSEIAALRMVLDHADPVRRDDDANAVGSWLLELRNLQTSVELVSMATQESNGQGFSAYNAEIGTSIANTFEKRANLAPRHRLSEKQWNAAKRIVKKHAGQVVEFDSYKRMAAPNAKFAALNGVIA